jgi:hypothetical protein
MQVFDASSIIYAWDNYPVRQFPRLWDWIAGQIAAHELVMPSVAFEEVKAKVPDCGQWLEDNDLSQVEITNAILQDARRVKQLLGIEGDNYHPKGVGENDILIICTARSLGGELVSDEGRQTVAPDVPSKRKIPSVCSLPGVAVPCINFIEYIKRSNAVF